MKSVVKSLVILALIALVAAPLSAADEKKKKGKKGADRAPQQVAAVVKQLKEAGLSDEQETKVKAIVAEFTPKFKELNAKMQAAIPAEVRKKRGEAMKKAREEGKKGKELQAAVAAAVDLSDEQQAEVKKVTGMQRELSADFRGKVLEILTDEQKAKVKLRAGAGKGKAAPKKAKNAKKPPKNPKSDTATTDSDK